MVTLFKRVDVGGGAVMFIPASDVCDAESINWHLRYGDAEQVRMQAATLLDSFQYLMSDDISLKEATRRLKLMRTAYNGNEP